MTLDEIEAAFRLGCCASARLASEGCRVCGPQMRALEAVREMARERDELRAKLTSARDASAWVRPPEGRDPATRTRALPVVPATCGECGYLGHTRTLGGGAEHRCFRLGKAVFMTYTASPPHWCPIRAELAKAGGA